MELVEINSGVRPDAIVKKLYRAGASVYQIASYTGLTREFCRGVLGVTSFDENFSPHFNNIQLQNQILAEYTNLKRLASSILSSMEVRNEAFAEIEKKGIGILDDMLTYYADEPNGDAHTDAFKLQLAEKAINFGLKNRTDIINTLTNINKIDSEKPTDEDDKLTIEIVQC